MNSTVNALHAVFQGNQEILSDSLEQLQAAIGLLKETREEVWDEVASESRDLVSKMARGVQTAMDNNVAQAADKVGQIVSSA